MAYRNNFISEQNKNMALYLKVISLGDFHIAIHIVQFYITLLLHFNAENNPEVETVNSLDVFY